MKVLPDYDWATEPNKLIDFLLKNTGRDEPILIVGIENEVRNLDLLSNKLSDDVVCVHSKMSTKKFKNVIKQWAAGEKRILLTITIALKNVERFAAAQHVVIGRNQHLEDSHNKIVQGYGQTKCWYPHKYGINETKSAIDNAPGEFSQKERDEHTLDLTYHPLRVAKLALDEEPGARFNGVEDAKQGCIQIETQLVLKDSSLGLDMSFNRPVLGRNKTIIALRQSESIEMDGVHQLNSDEYNDLYNEVLCSARSSYHAFHLRSNPTVEMATTAYLFSSTDRIKERAKRVLEVITAVTNKFSDKIANCIIIPEVDAGDLLKMRKVMLNIFNMPILGINTSDKLKSTIQFEYHILEEIRNFLYKFHLDFAEVWSDERVSIR